LGKGESEEKVERKPIEAFPEERRDEAQTRAFPQTSKLIPQREKLRPSHQLNSQLVRI
jgi:hypothetical protein